MRSAVFASFLATAVIACALEAAAAQSGIIDGRVTAPNGQPVANAHVTLTDDGYSPLGSRYTDAGGRFRFSVAGGVYYVEIDPAGQQFQSVRQRVEVNPAPFSRGGEIFRVDVTLVPLKPIGDRAAPAGGGLRFAQVVPEAARKEYERGMKLLKDDVEHGLVSVRRAIELFPDYYAARETLGTELVKAGRYEEARPVLVRALEINPSGGPSHYALGVLAYRTGKYSEAVTSLTEARSLEAKSPNVALYLGLALLRAGRPGDAEVELKRAYELGATGVADLHLALASVYIDSKRNREAATQLRLLLKEVPNLRDRDKIKALVEKLEKQ
jgi:tetratricopeptide (TPR) repeat protein